MPRIGRRGRWPSVSDYLIDDGARGWPHERVAPHKQDSWKVFKDPLFVAKVRDIVEVPGPPGAGHGALRGSRGPLRPSTAPLWCLPMLPGHPRARRPQELASESRHLESVRRAGSGHRQGDRLTARPAPLPGVFGVLRKRSTPQSPPIWIATSCSITPPLTERPR